MKIALIVLAMVAAGCATKPDATPWNAPAAWSPDNKLEVTASSYPDDAEQLLTPTQKADLAKLRATSHPFPSNSSFQSDPGLRAVYLDWYAKGYTYTATTRQRTLRPQLWVADSPERRAKLSGWEDGQFDASQKQLEEALEKLRGTQSGTANEAAPHR